MNHLFVCREYPPASYAPGGIGTYVTQMASLLTKAGETVHVIAERWEGAPNKTSVELGGRLLVHRISADDDVAPPAGLKMPQTELVRALLDSDSPSLAFSWQAAQLIEKLAESEQIDVVEAPEWEAPLYCYQLRRALGLGPVNRPPCLIHLHSASELIFRHNGWDQTFVDFAPLQSMEAYTVRAADALLCPSQYYVREAVQLFDVAGGDIRMIRYPLGQAARIERTLEVWRRDAILYLGRLELRKGIVEWVDAAIESAQSHPTVHFEFIGGDTPMGSDSNLTVREHLIRRIPAALRERFRFRQSVDRSKLAAVLAQVSAVAVPSRWDNLPYTCMEAMASGLPVLVSPNGGMAELVVDGESGWIAADGSAHGLAAITAKFLATPPERRAAMGRNAEAAVGRACGNAEVLREHLEFRSRVVHAGAARSLRIPSPIRNQGEAGSVSETAKPAQETRRGIGIVVTCFHRPDLLPDCLNSIDSQSKPPRIIAVVIEESDRRTPALLENSESDRFLVIRLPADSRARERAVDCLLSKAPGLGAVVFVRENARLDPEFLAVSESAFHRQPGLGLMSAFIRYTGEQPELDTAPCAGFDIHELDSAVCVAVRIPALGSAPVSGDRWARITYPDVLVAAIPFEDSPSPKPKRYSGIASAQRGSSQIGFRRLLTAPLNEKARWIGQAVREPRRAVKWFNWQFRAATGRTK